MRAVRSSQKRCGVGLRVKTSSTVISTWSASSTGPGRRSSSTDPGYQLLAGRRRRVRSSGQHWDHPRGRSTAGCDLSAAPRGRRLSHPHPTMDVVGVIAMSLTSRAELVPELIRAYLVIHSFHPFLGKNAVHEHTITSPIITSGRPCTSADDHLNRH